MQVGQYGFAPFSVKLRHVDFGGDIPIYPANVRIGNEFPQHDTND